MKKIFYSIILSLGILIINQSFSSAQSCAVVNSDATYEVCCSSQTISQNMGACNAYLSGSRCSNIKTTGDYSLCCGTNSPASNRSACSLYEDSVQPKNECSFISDDNTYAICCDDNQTIGPNIGACSAYIAGPRCAQIEDSGDYQLCCSGPTTPSVNRNACLQYNPANTSTFNGSCDSIKNDLDYARCCASYTPENTAICTAYLGIPDFDSTTPPSTGGSGSGTGQQGWQNSDKAVSECTNIKFISILNILIWAKCVLNSFVIPLIFTLAFVFFLWNIMVFIRQADNKQIKEEARQRMVWGMIALFIMVSVWGIIAIATNIFEIRPTVPMLQTEYLNPNNADK